MNGTQGRGMARGAARAGAAAVVALLALGSSKSADVADAEVYLKCSGKVGIRHTVSGPVLVAEKQELAVHVKEKSISFSGHKLLWGDKIPICPHKEAAVELNFDDDTCDALKTRSRRKYGTYNRVLLTLNVHNMVGDDGAGHIQGRFTCARTEPAPN